MGLGCCSRFAKYLLFAFNFLFWVVGAVLLGVGIWVLVDRDAAELIHVATASTSDALVKGAAVTLIIAGAFVFVVAFFGCFGACKESVCMLMTYAVIVGLILVIQIIAGILCAVFKDEIVNELSSSMNETVKVKYGQDGYEDTTDAFDYMQRSFKCCGATVGPDDYQDSAWILHNETYDNNTTIPVPLTCCTLYNPYDYDEEPNPVNATLCYNYAQNLTASDAYLYVNTEGCQPQLHDWIVNHSGILLGVAFGLAIVQLFGICFACMVAKGVRSEYEYV